jgi:hypothetical protein
LNKAVERGKVQGKSQFKAKKLNFGMRKGLFIIQNDFACLIFFTGKVEE